jgi:hypothetical protein
MRTRGRADGQAGRRTGGQAGRRAGGQAGRRIAGWITKTADTHSEYVILVAFPLQKWLHKRA